MSGDGMAVSISITGGVGTTVLVGGGAIVTVEGRGSDIRIPSGAAQVTQVPALLYL